MRTLGGTLQEEEGDRKLPLPRALFVSMVVVFGTLAVLAASVLYLNMSLYVNTRVFAVALVTMFVSVALAGGAFIHLSCNSDKMLKDKPRAKDKVESIGDSRLVTSGGHRAR